MGKDQINAFLGAETVYHGQLTFQGAVRIDGTFIGEIRSEGTLIIGQEAKIEGKIYVGQFVLSGQMTGEVAASQKAVLHRGAKLIGNLVAPVLIMEEGAKLDGQVFMSTKPAPQVGQSGQPALALEVDVEESV